MSILRDYQAKLIDELLAAWRSGVQRVAAVLPTGGGKTVILGKLAAAWPSSVQIAHRQELVGQISMALAREGVHHRIVAPAPIVRMIVHQHVEELGRSYYHESAAHVVAGVDTLLRRPGAAGDPDLCQMDECHHVLRRNKWGRALELFPRARVSGVTATFIRADGRKLSEASGDGVFQRLVQGPPMRELMRRGYLCQYVVYGPPPSIDRASVPISEETKDFTQAGLSSSARGSTIVGDVVASYLRFTPGKIGMTFAVDVEMAERHAEAFRQAGVPAVAVHQKTKNRGKIISDAKCGLIKQLVNCEVFTEGTDLPMLEVVSCARMTESLPLLVQMFGRMMRPYQGKEYGVFIDHVGNIHPRHGLPDGIVEWVMDEQPRRSTGPRMTPTRVCLQCFRAFESYSVACPYCGFRPERAEATEPEQVEGDLTEYGPELIQRLRAQADAAIRLPPQRPPQSGKDVVMFRNMQERAAAQHELREAMAWWAGAMEYRTGESDSALYRRFYGSFGIDAASARALSGPKARELTELLRKETWEL